VKKLIIVVLLLNCLSANAQPYYSKIFDLNGHWESFVNVLDVDSGKYNLLGASRNLIVDDSTKYGIVFISRINKNNEIDKTNKISRMFYTISYPNTIINLKNKLVFGLLDTNNNGSIPYKIINYDSNLVFSNEKELKFLPKSNLTNGYIYFQNNKLYFFCADYTTFVASKLKLSIQCMDTSGNRLWGKVYQDKRCYTNNVVQTKDGNFILAGLKYYGEGLGGDDSAFAWYAKVDTLGNMIWEKNLTRGSVLMSEATAITKADNNYYLTGTVNAKYTNSWYGDTSFCFMAKINENNGEIEWQKRFLYNVNRIQGLNDGFGGIVVFKNNYLYALIDHNVSERENPGDYSQYIMFAKLDLLGNFIWKRLFSKWYKSNRAYSLTPTEDGFLICGDAKDSTKAKGDADAWLIKTDTNGCIIPNCNAKDGIVQLINPEKVFTVYPNPAQNEINVSSINVTQKIENLAVYNMQGQLLKSINTKASNQQTINIEDLVNGNYLLIITTDKQQMAGKKFVVER
jgi:hypothetical protein